MVENAKEIFLNRLKQDGAAQWELDYERKNAEYVVQLEGEEPRFLVIAKPQIQKRFCSGAGWCGVASSEEWERACKDAQDKGENPDRFIKENLQEFEDQICHGWGEYLDECNRTGRPVRLFSGISCENNGGEVCIYSDYQLNRYFLPRKREEMNFKELTAHDIQNITEAMGAVRDGFIKRLHTYLKKYGLEHVHSWAYLVD